MARKHKGNPVHGWINLDKPVGLTSTQAIGKVRRILNAGKAGHAGTLDPLASGILPIALGEATKTIPFVQDSLKIYEFTVTWGEQRTTDDMEGEVMESSDVRPAPSDIEGALPAFIGEIEQMPPKFSAIKIDGQRAYDLARAGEDFDIQARQVYIESLELLDTDSESARFVMTCGKGTYVRSLARDMGVMLGTYGYVSALRRSGVGPFTLEHSISLAKLEEMRDSAAALDEFLLPLETALDDIPALVMKEGEMAKLRNGNAVPFIAKPDFDRLSKAGIEDEGEALALYKGKAIALITRDGPYIKPFRVFNI